MSALALLLRETADLQAEVERAIDAARATKRPLPFRFAPNDGRHWRTLAACKRELDVLTGKAQLADDVARNGIDAHEFMERWRALEEMRKAMVTT